MVEITNRSNSGEVKYTDAIYEMTGDFRQDPTSKKIISLNLSANKIDNGYMGNVNAFMESGELKLNMNSVPVTEMSGVASGVTNCIQEIEKEIV